jgi:hypothetical protein
MNYTLMLGLLQQAFVPIVTIQERKIFMPILEIEEQYRKHPMLKRYSGRTAGNHCLSRYGVTPLIPVPQPRETFSSIVR